MPERVRNSLVWFQRLADVDFGAGKVELQTMVRSSKGPSAEEAPEPAPMIPPDVVRRLERGCSHASTGVLKIFCGLGCLLTFGVKRWSDAQRVQYI